MLSSYVPETTHRRRKVTVRYNSVIQCSPFSYELEGMKPWPLPMYWYYQQPYQPHLATYQTTPPPRPPLPAADSDTEDDEDDDNKGDPRPGVRGLSPNARVRRRNIRAQSTSPGKLPIVPISQQFSLIHSVSLRSTASGAVSATKKPRPANWRHDYSTPSSPWFRKRFVQIRYMIKDEVPTSLQIARSTLQGTSLTLNPLLQCPSSLPPTYYLDLRNNPFTSYLLHLPTSNGPVNELHWLQLATTPTVHQLHLFHARLPWVITVRSGNPSGLLVSDIMRHIYTQLMLPIGKQDWWNAEMSAEDREAIEESYKVRCNGDIAMLAGGIRRVDWLGPAVGFVGLVKAWNGMLEIKTVDIYSESNRY